MVEYFTLTIFYAIDFFERNLNIALLLALCLTLYFTLIDIWANLAVSTNAHGRTTTTTILRESYLIDTTTVNFLFVFICYLFLQLLLEEIATSVRAAPYILAVYVVRSSTRSLASLS